MLPPSLLIQEAEVFLNIYQKIALYDDSLS